MTLDEELSQLEESLRRLKIEYDIYFNGGSQRPPKDTLWRVDSLIRKFSDSPKLSFAQRFRYNALAQRYAVFNDLWRQRIKAREEGPRKTVAEVRKEALKGATFRVEWRDPAAEPEKVQKLFEALIEAKKLCGERLDNIAADAFKKFVLQKTAQLKRDFKCEQVQYAVEVEDGQVKLKAKAV